ncbi:hypothetical protein [Streptomyces sp. NPDC055134]
MSEHVGEQCARQGVPLALLLEVARLDFRVVCAALVRNAGDDHAAQVVGSARRVWEAAEGAAKTLRRDSGGSLVRVFEGPRHGGGGDARSRSDVRETRALNAS